MKTALFAIALLLNSGLVYCQCKSIKPVVDKFTGSTKINSDILSPISVIKNIEKSDTVYYLSLRTPAPTFSLGKTGVVMLLENGQRLEWPDQKVDVDVEKYRHHWNTPYYANVFIRLTPEDRTKLLSGRVTDYKLYIYAYELPKKMGSRFQEQFSCVLLAK